MLEDTWGLSFSKEAGGEIIEVVSPGYYHIRIVGVVKFQLVKTGCHISLVKLHVLGYEGGEGWEGFILNGGVDSGDIEISGVHQEAPLVRSFLFEGEW